MSPEGRGEISNQPVRQSATSDPEWESRRELLGGEDLPVTHCTPELIPGFMVLLSMGEIIAVELCAI